MTSGRSPPDFGVSSFFGVSGVPPRSNLHLGPTLVWGKRCTDWGLPTSDVDPLFLVRFVVVNEGRGLRGLLSGSDRSGLVPRRRGDAPPTEGRVPEPLRVLSGGLGVGRGECECGCVDSLRECSSVLYVFHVIGIYISGR